MQAKFHISSVEYSQVNDTEFEPVNRLKNVNCLSFSQNGNFCAFAIGNQITLWDVRSVLYPMCKLSSNIPRHASCEDVFWSPMNSLLGCVFHVPSESIFQSLLIVYSVQSSQVLYELK